MRIQHNIMAMNAYRNYNTNTSALSKNLEKLSSGYKINRAGDDAAGLAISEKMRAQITGLNAAQKNVKDGISLVKTAEGAMQEIQDMLNRMDYLATQSANGTYQDEVDREALQKEVNQLKSEIDRIADSANFNGIKLLDGGLDGSGNSLKVAQGAANAAAAEVTRTKNLLDEANNMEVEGKLTEKSSSDVKSLFLDSANPSTSIGDVGTKTILETDDIPTGPVGFTVDLDGVEYTMSAGTDTAEKVTLTIHGVGIDITQQDIKTLLTDAADGSKLTAGDVVTGAQLAEVITKKLAAGTDGVWEDTASTAPAGGARDKYKVTANGTKLVFAAQNNHADNKNRHYDVSIAATNANANEVAATKDKLVTGALSVGTGGTITKDEVISLQISYKDADGTDKTETISYTVQQTDAADATTLDDADDITAGLVAAINNNTNLKALFKATGSTATGGITIEALEAGEGHGDLTKLEVTNGGTNSKIEIADGAAANQVQANDAYTAGLGNTYVNKGTENIVQAGDDGKAILASTTLTFTTDHLKNGSLIKIGNEEYRIAIGENSAYKGEVNASGVREFNGAKVVYLTDTNATLDQIASKLAETAKNNGVFTVSHEGTGGQIGLKQLESVKGDKGASGKVSLRTMNEFVNQVKVSTITTAGDQAIKDKAIAEAQAAYDAAVEKQEAADAKVAELSKNPGKPLQLQIGDTSDDYNQLKVSIGDMHTAALNIGDLDIGTAEKASGAIQTIKDAINNVSSVRGDLGAYQNRLEHTANNLSVMAENITDAESTIRDTDVAEEMMAYTKNNILIQSAQAMLAQANAVPQGVLQLLG